MDKNQTRRKLQEQTRNNISGANRLWYGWDSLGFSSVAISVIQNMLPNLTKEMKQQSYRIPRKEKNLVVKYEEIVEPIDQVNTQLANRIDKIRLDIQELQNIISFQMPEWFAHNSLANFNINEAYLKDCDGYDLILTIRQNIDYWAKYSIDEDGSNSHKIIKDTSPLNYMDIDNLKIIEVGPIKKNKKVYWILGVLGISAVIAIIVCVVTFFV